MSKFQSWGWYLVLTLVSIGWAIYYGVKSYNKYNE